jgi:MFS family permease
LPPTRVGARFVAVYAAGYFGVWIPLLTPVVVTLALKVQDIDPANKTQNLSLVLGGGALVALLAQPAFGALSDRTTSRFGMRRPWLAVGMAGGTAGLLIVATAGSVLQVLLGWCICQLMFNATAAALTALLPDQVPENQRGLVSGTIAVTTPLALVLGAFIAQIFAGSMLLMFLAPAAIGWVPMLALLTTLHDRRLERASRRRFRASDLLLTFWVNPLDHRDFGWAWASRFLTYLGWATVTSYQPLYLVDHLHRGPAEVPRLVFYGLAAQTVFVLLSSQLSGWLSDRLRRRKLFVFLGAAMLTAGLLTVALAPAFEVFVVGLSLSGAGLGVYATTHLALAASVLPTPETAAKDLGVLNLANTLPQSLAPALAPLFLLTGGGGKNYTLLFLTATMYTFLGGLAIAQVRAR